jgi:hypothetical protein
MKPEANLGLVPTDDEVSPSVFPDNPSGAAMEVLKILMVLDALSGNADGSAVE